MSVSGYPFISSAHIQQKLATSSNLAQNQIVDELAYEYAKTVAFRTYYLSTSKTELLFDTNHPLNYYALGCHGDGGEAQHSVAKHLNQIMAGDKNASLVFMTGDNLYSSGASSPSSKQFKTCFDNVYLKPEFEHSKKKKYICGVGNHDKNIQRIIIGESGNSVLLNQVAHTYTEQMKKFLKDGSAKTPEEALEKVKSIFENKIKHPIYGEIYLLNIDDLLAWNMFSPAYSIVAGNVEFFCLDSNQLAEDIVDYLIDETENQVAGFVRAYDKAMSFNDTDHRRVATGIIMHHIPKTPGARHYGNDFTYYCKDPKKRALIYQTLGLDPKKNHSTHEVVDVALQKLKEKQLQKRRDLKVNFIHGAHDHNLYLEKTHIKEKDKNYYDWAQCVGGGGGALQPMRKYFGNQEDLGIFIPKNGFGQFSINQTTGEMSVSLHTTDKTCSEHELYVFNQNDMTQPRRAYPETISANEITQIKKLCAATKRALDAYFAFYHKKQEETGGHFVDLNLSHRADGINRAHLLWDYISQLSVDNYETTLNTIFSLANKTNNPIKVAFSNIKKFAHFENEHSLVNAIDAEFSREFERSLYELWKERFAFNHTKAAFIGDEVEFGTGFNFQPI